MRKLLNRSVLCIIFVIIFSVSLVLVSCGSVSEYNIQSQDVKNTSLNYKSVPPGMIIGGGGLEVYYCGRIPDIQNTLILGVTISYPSVLNFYLPINSDGVAEFYYTGTHMKLSSISFDKNSNNINCNVEIWK